ncbi:TetR/AcrR family transcriptional regulator [Amycolatopsis jejuensis]|uniref:TetR/AcrR family transcriptional regulator n=1 Tax=Amycolatopsis jejuensis TaxID=330084 RepID=UPI0005265373|nr:TetR/AcrR family transcriptional regulator [Amycolatopsis jejuensis]
MPARPPLQPRKQPKQVRGELTRQRILTAAAEVFAEVGYAAGTTNRIAERARVSIGSLYQYYPNKDALLAELVSRHLARGEEAQRHDRETNEQPDTFEGEIRRMVRLVVGNHLDDPQLLRLMFEEAPRSPDLLRQVEQAERAQIAELRLLFGRYPEVRVSDVDMAARLVVNTVELVVHKVIADPDPVDVDVFGEELVTMFLRYLAPGAAPEGEKPRPAAG